MPPRPLNPYHPGSHIGAPVDIALVEYRFRARAQIATVDVEQNQRGSRIRHVENLRDVDHDIDLPGDSESRGWNGNEEGAPRKSREDSLDGPSSPRFSHTRHVSTYCFWLPDAPPIMGRAGDPSVRETSDSPLPTVLGSKTGTCCALFQIRGS